MAELLEPPSDSAIRRQLELPYASSPCRAEESLLTAEWRNLVMLNYEIDAEVLRPLLPLGTELDLFAGQALISIVGFEFLAARWRGWSIPYHQNFPEVNLRFYVKRRTPRGWRRGVVFVKEIAPRWMVAQVARRVYHENYACRAMRHAVKLAGNNYDSLRDVTYQWRERGHWQHVAASTCQSYAPCERGSLEKFIVEHYWCYTRVPGGITREYRVEHPPWRIAPADACELACDVRGVYGSQFAPFLHVVPKSAFLVDGSAVVVRAGRRIDSIRGGRQVRHVPSEA